MFVLQQAQLDALASSRERQYREDLLRHFRRDGLEPARAPSDEMLRSTIAHALDQARRLGVVSANGLLRYVSLAVLVSPDFDQIDEVRRLLDAPGFDQDYKVQLLSELLIARLERG